jgi:hypothetical protein
MLRYFVGAVHNGCAPRCNPPCYRLMRFGSASAVSHQPPVLPATIASLGSGKPSFPPLAGAVTAKITPLEVSNVGTGDLSSVGVRVNMEDSRLIAQFQRLTTELLIEKRLGRRRPELTDELYRTWLEVDQRDLKETPEYRNVMKRADRHALWLAGLVMLSTSAPLSSKETEPIITDEAA